MSSSSSRYSAALCRGLIEAQEFRSHGTVFYPGIPRLYAAASLKRRARRSRHRRLPWYSAALCRGLIEASRRIRIESWCTMYSAALCRGLIEAMLLHAYRVTATAVFRGSMPRPH